MAQRKEGLMRLYAALAVIAVVAVLVAAANRRAKRRQAIVDGIVADARGLLKVPVWQARPTFGRAAVKWDGKTLLRCHCRYGHGPKDTYVTVKTALPLTVTHRLGYPVTVEWNHPKHSFTIVRVEPAKPLPARVDHPVGAVKRDRLPLGVDNAGNTVAWAIDQQPHCLLVGATGAGKSCAIRTLVAEAVRAGLEVTVCDPKRISFRGFRDWPGVTVATSDQAMAAAIAAAHDEQERRYAGIEDGTLNLRGLGRYLLVIDELHELIERLGPDSFNKVRSIARMGREGGVHLVVGIQRPDSAVISGSFRDQLALRVALGHLTGQAQQMVGTVGQVTASHGQIPKGRALAVVGDQAVEVQTFWTPDPADPDLSKGDRAVLAALRPVRASNGANTGTNTAANEPANGAANGLPDALAADKVDRIRQLRAEGLTVRAVAAEVGVSNAAVHKYQKRPALHLVKDA
jgi:hypothetical protein